MYGQNREAHAAGDTINKGPYAQALPDTLLFFTHVDSGPLVSIAPRPEAGYKAPQSTIAAVSGTMIVQNRQNTSDRAQLKNIEWDEPAARTAVGILPDRRQIIVAVVEGDLVPAMGLPGRSIGISLPELGQWMIELGAVDVMNLNGGGSSFFLYRQPPLYQTLNQVKDKFPNGSQGRQVRPTSTLLIFKDGGPVALQAQRLEGVPTPAGCTVSHTAGSLSAAGSYTINRNGELQLTAATIALQPKTSVLMEIPGQPARTAFHAGPQRPPLPTAAQRRRCANSASPPFTPPRGPTHAALLKPVEVHHDPAQMLRYATLLTLATAAATVNGHQSGSAPPPPPATAAVHGQPSGSAPPPSPATAAAPAPPSTTSDTLYRGLSVDASGHVGIGTGTRQDRSRWWTTAARRPCSSRTVSQPLANL